MKSYGATDRGLVRPTNQDSFAVEKRGEQTLCAVICDGVGGENAGDVASSLAVSVITERVRRGLRGRMSSASMKNLLESSITAANDAVYGSASENPAYRDMGTTAVAACVSGGDTVVANVGDSRAYFYADGKITQVTHDHSVVRSLVDSGQITETEARNHPKKNSITRAVGASRKIDIDFYFLAPIAGDRLLLCSDGLTDFVENSQIESIISNTPEEKIVDSLISAAKAGGGGDNITAVLLIYD